MGNRAKNKMFRKGLALLLSVAMTLTTLATDGLALAAKAEAAIAVTASAGYEEGAYVTWTPVEGADGYEVFVSTNQSDWTKLDDELIRQYDGYMRADALGLTAGKWYVKIVAATYNSAREQLNVVAEEVKEVTVTAHDRSGYAWQNGIASGAYNEDGSLKENAKVLYLTDANKNKISLTVTTSEGPAEYVGIQNIMSAYRFGLETTPLNIRIIGTITDPATLVSGDLAIRNGKNGTGGITIEGIGEDAVIRGFGFSLEDTSNMEIRNLAFMLCDSVEGDNVSLVNGNDHIWVHHCDFFYGMPGAESDQVKGDGMLDCKLSNYVTFSYNHFWDSGKSCLLGLEGENDGYCITYHHNWFDHSDSRHPRVRSYTAHVYNNYYDGNSKYSIGATNGASVFAENNYFRGSKWPMAISMQGSEAGSVLSGENGGMIKAYGNYMEGQTKFVPYVASGDANEGTAATGDGSDMRGDSVEFDAYVARSREEQVPATVTAKKGGATYSNFDTAEGFYTYSVTPVKQVPTVVMANAGRLNGGDFSYRFDYAGADANHDVDAALKAKLEAYTSKLVAIGGILGASEKSFVTVHFDTQNGGQDVIEDVKAELNQPMDKPADPTHVPEGYVTFGYWMNGDKEWDFADAVTADMTLTAKWYTQMEYDATLRGGTPIGNEPVQFIIANQTVGFGNPYFEISGSTLSAFATSATYDRIDTETKNVRDRNRLVLEGSAYIKFNTTTEKSMLAFVLENTQPTNVVQVDGKSVTAKDGVVLADLEAGEHTITAKTKCYAYVIMVFPNESVPVEAPEDTGIEESPDNIALNAGEDVDVTSTEQSFGTDTTIHGFTMKGTVKYDNQSPKTVDGVSYGGRLKLTSGGSLTAKSIKFTAKENATLKVVVISGKSAETRNLILSTTSAGGAENKLETVPCTGTAFAYTKKLPAAGDYYLYSDLGVNVYFLSVTYPDVYRVSFVTNGGTAVEPAKVAAGAKVTEPAEPQREDYFFGGWYSDEALTKAYDFAASVTAPITLYAKWSQAYKVHFETNCDAVIEDQYVEPGQKVVAPDAMNYPGHLFGGWYVAGEDTPYDFATEVQADLNLYAVWKPSGLYVEFVNPGEEYTYTGSAIKPEIFVTNNGELLIPGVDYTIAYKNNINASTDLPEGSPKKPSIVITGKGNLTAAAPLYFEIEKKSINDEDVLKGDIVAESAAKAAPVLYYNGMLLKNNKDFKAAVITIGDESQMVVTALGNYTGVIKNLDITIKAKAELKKLAVALPKTSFVYDGTEKVIEDLLVADAKDKSKTPLKLDTDYILDYQNNVNAGTAKVTVIGIGAYSGSVSKTFKISPKVVTGKVTCSGIDKAGYEYRAAGVTVEEDLQVVLKDGASEATLALGKDYTLKYSNNKKVGTGKVTVNFIGNYKGTKAVDATFGINSVGLEAAGAVAVAADKVYTKAGVYQSAPMVSVDNVLINKADYVVTYYLDAGLKTEMSKTNQLTIADGESSKTVYAKIVGKGNYASKDTGDYIVAEYVVKAVDKQHDLSKAKVTLLDANGQKLTKMEYTGTALEAVTVQVQFGKEAPISSDKYEVRYVNNVNKGKATVVITAKDGSEYAGSKTATFSIVSKNLKNTTTIFDLIKALM